jgi:hypothetical protein
MPGGVKCRRNRILMMLSETPIFTIHAELGEIRHFGQTPYGERRVVDILGGRIEGPRLKGRILPGADWQIVRPDGVTDLQARYAIETDRGTRILVTSDGLRHGPPEVIAALARGEAVDPSRPPILHWPGSTAFWRSASARAKSSRCGSMSTRWCECLTGFGRNVTERRQPMKLGDRRERGHVVG